MKKDLIKAHSPFNPDTTLQLRIRKDGTVFGRWVNIDKDMDNLILERNFQDQIQEDFPSGVDKVLTDNKIINDFINFITISTLEGLSPNELMTYHKFLSYLLGIRFLLPDEIILDRNNYRLIRLSDSIYEVKFENRNITHLMVVENDNGKLKFTSARIDIDINDIRHPSFVLLYTMSSFLKTLRQIDDRFVPGVNMSASTSNRFIGVGVWPYKGAIIYPDEFVGFLYLEDILRAIFKSDDVDRFINNVVLTTQLPIDMYYSIHPYYVNALNAKFRWINDTAKRDALDHYHYLTDATIDDKSKIVRSSILQKMQNSDTVLLRDILKFENMMIEAFVADPRKVYKVYSTFNFA